MDCKFLKYILEKLNIFVFPRKINFLLPWSSERVLTLDIRQPVKTQGNLRDNAPEEIVSKSTRV